MAQACIFLATGYEEVEMLTVVDMLRRAKISIDMVSITDQKEVTSSHNVTITADKILSEVNFDEAEMLILPGGIPGTPNLRACDLLCEKLKEFAANGKKVAAVCAAPTVLGELGILAGKKATCYPSFADKLATGDYVKLPVVTDGNVITSRGMGTAIEFALAIVEYFSDHETAVALGDKFIYSYGA